MVNSTKIASISCLALAGLLYAGSINKLSTNRTHSIVFMYFSGIFVGISVLLEGISKGSNINVKDILGIIAVILALLLLFLSAHRNWGLLASTIIVSISILTTLELII